MRQLAAIAFGENWKPPVPDPPDLFIVLGLAFVSLIFACYILRMVTVGHWSEYRGAWVPIVIMILLFMIGVAGLGTVLVLLH
jgi:hypothetical protein